MESNVGRPTPNSPDWLHAFLRDALRRNLCVRVHCTTCGAMDFRRGLIGALAAATGVKAERLRDRPAAFQAAKALADLRPSVEESFGFEPAVQCILFDLWSGVPSLDREIETTLGDSWAGNLLQGMKAHHAAREAERRARENFQDPENVRKRREEKKRLKHERHAQRMAEQKEKGRLWHERHGKKD